LSRQDIKDKSILLCRQSFVYEYVEETMKRQRVVLYLLLALMAPALSGCWYVAAAGAGAAGGYILKDKGYKVQSPVEKEETKR
jgi:RsiW-degrading membrane proteinase PrsW (M82 family)